VFGIKSSRLKVATRKAPTESPGTGRWNIRRPGYGKRGGGLGENVFEQRAVYQGDGTSVNRRQFAKVILLQYSSKEKKNHWP